jgi:uncharacterized protein YndB with AHSA1/START domain
MENVMPMIDPMESLTLETPSDREVVLTRSFAAARRLVFDAWTKPEHVTRWMLGPEGWTMPVCEIDLRPGGSWRFVWRKADGAEMEMTGTYREVVPSARLVHTETWGPEWPETWNTLVLTEEEGITTAVLTVLYPSREARDAALETDMKSGLDTSYDRLAAYLKTLA